MSESIVRTANTQDFEPLARLFDSYRQFYGQAPNIELEKVFITTRLNNQDSVIFGSVSV